jgi:type III secretion protein V
MFDRFKQPGSVHEILGDHSDVVLAGLVIGIIGMMIVPLPTPLLDILLTLNITAAVTLLMVSLYVPRALDIAAFPSILLLTTLFRLGLNISTTRLILLDADAGSVVDAFGHFVVQGNFVVGAVIFLIITIIQFIVIAKGSERVSEVAARFTLDAMPGKQMSIDADLRAGAFDMDEARRRRGEVQRESQLFGSMDGAMKFVKGDAIAGIVITVINIIAGLIIGILQQGMPAGEAAQTYTLLTIGDGLVSQIPALLVSMTAGVIVTRVADGSDDSHLGSDIFTQLTNHPKAIAIAAGLLGVLAAVPGLPTGPFLAMGVAVGLVAWGLFDRTAADSALGEPDVAEVDRVEDEARQEAMQAEMLIPAVTPLTLEMGTELTAAISDERLDWLEEMTAPIREGIFHERGVKIPALRIRPDSRRVAADAFSIRIDEVNVDRAVYPIGKQLVDASSEDLEIFQVAAASTRHPVHHRPASWVGTEEAEGLEEAGYGTWDVAGYLVLRLTATLGEQAHEFVTIQQVQGMLEQLERLYPALVEEASPKVLDRQALTEVLRRLAEEGVSLRYLPKMLQTLADRGQAIQEPALLVEEVRAGLSRYITDCHADPDGTVVVYVVDPEVESTIEGAIRHGDGGRFLALDPDLSRRILDNATRVMRPDIEAGRTPIVLTGQDVRVYVRKLLALEVERVTVLSYRELSPSLKIQPIAEIAL